MTVRIRPTFLVAALAVLTLGCGALGVRDQETSGPPTPIVSGEAAPPSPGPSSIAGPTTAPPSPSVDPLVLSVDGIGPYRLGTGATLDQLQGTGVLTSVANGGEACPQHFGAQGTGQYTGIRLWFLPDRKLDFVIARAPTIRTPSGARVGNTLAELQTIYGSRGEVLTVGGAKAYIVRVASSGRAIFFELDLANAQVIAVYAGGGDRLAQRFLGGSDC